MCHPVLCSTIPYPELDVLADLADRGVCQPLDEIDLWLLDDEVGRALGGVGDRAGVLPRVGRLGLGDLQDLQGPNSVGSRKSSLKLIKCPVKKFE